MLTDAIEHLRLYFPRPLQQHLVIGRECFYRLPQRLHLVFAVFGEVFNTRQQQQPRCVFNDQRVAIHPRRATFTNHARHAGVAAVVYCGVENTFEDQSLLVEVLVKFAFSTPGAHAKEIGLRTGSLAA
jgi:hypothetical protein